MSKKLCTSYGYLKYDPRHKNTRNDSWWLILEVGHGLVKMNKWLLEKEGTKVVSSDDAFGHTYTRTWPVVKRGVKVSESAWKPHVSVVRGERPRNKRDWKKYNGKKVWFKYSPLIIRGGPYYWLEVYSNELEFIRKELGLPRLSSGFDFEYYEKNGVLIKRKPMLHLTIGKDIDAPPNRGPKR